ncbi:O-antigen ligase family protein [Arenibacter palladensis]|nr:O-antigen ligase family protein [Arenibacter palladensis]
MLFTDYYLAVALVKGFTNINLLNIFEHRLYIGISILMITPFLLEEIVLEKKILLRISKILILLLSFYMVYSSGSRILMVSMIAIVLILLYKYIKPKINKRVFFAVFFVSVLAGLTILSFHPRTKLTWELLSKNKPLSKLDNRLVTWDNALKIISEQPVFGTGLGDSKNEMFNAYKKNGDTFELQNELNVHNQYLQIILESGLIGFFLFLCFVYSFYQGAKEKGIYVQTVLIVFGFSFLIESVLSRNLGVFPLTFWIFILLLSDNISPTSNYRDNKNLKNIVLKTSTVLTLGLVFAMLLFSKLKTFDSTDPKTYMTTPFNYVHYNNLPNKDQLPKVTDACSISLNDNFTNYERGVFLAPEVFSTKIDVRVSLTYGIWCYISTDSNINEAYTYAWDRVNVSFRDEYDLTKKGTWQFLSLNDKTFSNSFAAGVRIDLRREFPKMEGKVYFAMPHFKIKNE